MDSRLYFTVTLVALAWLSASTCNAANDTNTTAANMTTNMTQANTTQANTTSASNTTANPTAAPPLQYNSTVSALDADLNSDDCGHGRLCVGVPSDCNPAKTSCTLLGAKLKGGNIFEFLLAGQSDGYLAALVSFGTTLGGNDSAYICFNDSGQIRFTGARLNNNALTKSDVNANNVRGKINGKKIQCLFDATVDSTIPRDAKASNAALAVASGSYNSTTGALGAPTILIRTNSIDISNPNQTVTNLAASSNTTNTTSNAISFRQTLVQALVISAGVMGLSVL